MYVACSYNLCPASVKSLPFLMVHLCNDALDLCYLHKAARLEPPKILYCTPQPAVQAAAIYLGLLYTRCAFRMSLPCMVTAMHDQQAFPRLPDAW